MPDEALAGIAFDAARPGLEAIFHAQYDRIARVIAGVIKHPARAEELAVEVFLKWERTPNAQGAGAEGWLYRTAIRAGLTELRRNTRRTRYERLLQFLTRADPGGPRPDDLLTAQQEQHMVRLVLSAIKPRQAELLLLRSHDLSYEELAAALNLNPASVGTLLSRAMEAFRKEYTRRYGKVPNERQ